MIYHILRAPINLYFDTTPLGRIMNRFSTDLNLIEVDGLRYRVESVMSLGSSVTYTLIVAIFAIPQLVFVFPIMICLLWCLISSSTSAISETVRLEATMKSKVLGYLTETISGCSTIRAFHMRDRFVTGNNKILD